MAGVYEHSCWRYYSVCCFSVIWMEVHCNCVYKKKKKENSVDTGQGQHVTGTCLNNSPLLTHQCIGFCLFLTPFKIASFPRHPQGFAELPWIIWRAGEGRQANNNYHIFTIASESTGPEKGLLFFFYYYYYYSKGSWDVLNTSYCLLQIRGENLLLCFCDSSLIEFLTFWFCFQLVSCS